MKNYYYILGVTQSSSSDEIKKAYRKLSVKFHPDKNDGDIFFEERFKEIQEAFEILSNELQRRYYDIQYLTFFTKQNSSFNFKNYEEQIRKEYETLIQKERELLKNKENELKKKEEQLKSKQKDYDSKTSDYASQSKRIYEDQYKSKFEELKREKEEIEKLKSKLNRKCIEKKQSSHKSTLLVLSITCLLLIISSIFLYNKSQFKLPENSNPINLDSENVINIDSPPKLSRIETIRAAYAKINGCKNCTDKEYKSSCGWLSLRYEKDILNKITISEDVVGDFTIAREFYLNNMDLLFIYEIIVDRDGIKTENRYYFENNKIIRQITPNSKSQFSFVSNETDLIYILNEIIERNNNGNGYDDILRECG